MDKNTENTAGSSAYAEPHLSLAQRVLGKRLRYDDLGPWVKTKNKRGGLLDTTFKMAAARETGNYFSKHETEIRKATLVGVKESSIKARFGRIYFQEEEMPTHCCVPECTKKCYRKDDGTKVSYF